MHPLYIPFKHVTELTKTYWTKVCILLFFFIATVTLQLSTLSTLLSAIAYDTSVLSSNPIN